MLDERLDDSSSSRLPQVLVGLSAGGALLTILLIAISFLHRRKTADSSRSISARGGFP